MKKHNTNKKSDSKQLRHCRRWLTASTQVTVPVPVPVPLRKADPREDMSTGLSRQLRAECHWIVPQRILLGAEPRTDLISNELYNQIGVDTVLCLTEENRCASLEEEVRCLHFAIVDYSVPDAKELVNLFDDAVLPLLVPSSAACSKMYIHCASGHGRTGLVGLLLMQALFGVSPAESVLLCNAYHRSRSRYESSPNCRARTLALPETDEQLDFTRRLHPEMMRLHRKHF